MNILGPESLLFGVDDVPVSTNFLIDYGLRPVGLSETGGTFEAADGTSVEIRHMSDSALPAGLGTSSLLRKTTYGVADAQTLEDIKKELATDREVKTPADGSLEVVDDMGFVLGFMVSVKRPIHMSVEAINAPGAPPQRGVNVIAVDEDAVIVPRTLSHVVYFVPDAAVAEAFYVKRLGFRCTDRFVGVGPFLQPAGNLEHHTLFLIQTPGHMKGVEHFTFHLGGPTEVMQAGTRFVAKGHKSFWGPGRHRFGSNWFWYFDSPLKCHIEYDADMDRHDASWVAREARLSADASQLFLFQHREKWAPTGPLPKSDH